MVKSYNGATFRWYFPKAKTFSGIFLKSGSFNGTKPIFPNKKDRRGRQSLGEVPAAGLHESKRAIGAAVAAAVAARLGWNMGYTV
jgi:hypothetical protein